MTPAAAKAKGRRCAKQAIEILLEASRYFPRMEEPLTEKDLRPASSGQTGEDILMSEAATKIYPFAIECKNVEKLNVPKAFEQAKSHVKGNQTPLLVHTKNHGELLCTLRFKDLIYLMLEPK